MAATHNFQRKNGKWIWNGNCEQRNRIHPEPKDITDTLSRHLPLDDKRSDEIIERNLHGLILRTTKLDSGIIFSLKDHKRLVYEVGCDTVIYLHLSPTTPKHYHFFIQPLEAFMWAVTTKDLASQVQSAAAPILKIAKYEMYFLMGMVSTVSIPALIAVIGVDMTYQGVVGHSKLIAGKELVKDLSTESSKLKSSTPTLHKKLNEFVTAETELNKGKMDRLKTKLPETIITDDKTQGMLAGALVGKATLAPKAFTAWTAIFTILTSAATKSLTKSPEAYAKVIDDKYRPALDQLLNTNWDNAADKKLAAAQLVKVFRDAGVKVSETEALLIIKEVHNHPGEIQQSFIKLDRSFREFNKALKK